MLNHIIVTYDSIIFVKLLCLNNGRPDAKVHFQQPPRGANLFLLSRNYCQLQLYCNNGIPENSDLRKFGEMKQGTFEFVPLTLFCSISCYGVRASATACLDGGPSGANRQGGSGRLKRGGRSRKRFESEQRAQAAARRCPGHGPRPRSEGHSAGHGRHGRRSRRSRRLSRLSHPGDGGQTASLESAAVTAVVAAAITIPSEGSEVESPTL